MLQFEPCNQYTTQGDLFSKSIRQGMELPAPLEGSVRNMAVIEAIFRSAGLSPRSHLSVILKSQHTNYLGNR